jgi:hypothetical protein
MFVWYRLILHVHCTARGLVDGKPVRRGRTCCIACVFVDTGAPRTVYLDLNHWYVLGDALAGHPLQPEHLDLVGQLTTLVEQGQIMFPLSSVHYMELSENPRDEYRKRAADVMAVLSRFNTITAMKKIVDEELALALNRKFGRPAFPVKVQKFGVGVWFALHGESKGFRLTGGSDESRRELEVRSGRSIAQLEDDINAVTEYELLKQPPKAYWDQIPDYDPYAARREADRDLESFNVMLETLRTNQDIQRRPLDAICARQFYFEIQDNYIQALINAGYSINRPPPLTTREALTWFLMSMPSRRVIAMMQYHYLKDLRRDWTINDLRDITALAKAIPYCDIVVTDSKAWDAAVNRAHLDLEFGTKILRRLSDLAAYL